MSGGGQSDQNTDKNAYAILWIIGLIILIGFVIWWFFSEQLKWAFIYVRAAEAKFVGLFTDKLDVLIKDLNVALPDDITIEAAAFVSEEIGKFMMYPAIGILILMALYMLKNHSFMRWHTKHNMDTLMRQEQKNWPQISPVVPIDLANEDINKGPWAMAMNPMQFSKRYKLLKVERIADRRAMWRTEGVFQATLIREKAFRVFANQMGPLWQGPEKLPPHVKTLYALFMGRIEHQADEVRNYLGELSHEAAKGELRYSRTDEFLKKYGQAKAGIRCAQRHAYVYTVMASLLVLARSDGVFASADFLWLKPVDRKLWYMLNTVGRQVAPAEVAGPWAHWLAEREMHRALSVPMVEEAVNALEKALANMIYQPDENEDFPLTTPDEV